MPPNPKNPLRTWTAVEIDQIKSMSGYGLTVEKIGHVFGISKATMERYARRDPRIRDALEKGRSEAESLVSQSLFSQAVGQAEVIEIDQDGNRAVVQKAVPPNTTAGIFWLKCRARWTETQNIKVDQTIAPGGEDAGKTWAQVAQEMDKANRESLAKAPKKPQVEPKISKPKQKSGGKRVNVKQQAKTKRPRGSKD